MTKCKGCGVTLQFDDEKAIGYSPKKDAEYCQRCFRIMHYDDLGISMKKGIDPTSVIAKIATMDAVVLWVVDLFDFEASMIEGINRHLNNKDIIMVATKRDVLPQTLSNEKIAKFIFGRLKELGIKISGLIVTGKKLNDGKEEVMQAVDVIGKGKEIVVMGKANAGKSTLLNSLMDEDVLTSSRYPGTTLDFNKIVIDNHTFIDTPGIEGKKTILMDVKEDDLKTILPTKQIKPMIYQLRGNQSFTFGGLARIDLEGCDNATLVVYMSDSLKVHRSKMENAEALWEKHYGELFEPVTISDFKSYKKVSKNMDKMDVVIDGLGWACVSGQVTSIGVYYPSDVNVTFRKAML